MHTAGQYNGSRFCLGQQKLIDHFRNVFVLTGGGALSGVQRTFAENLMHCCTDRRREFVEHTVLIHLQNELTHI